MTIDERIDGLVIELFEGEVNLMTTDGDILRNGFYAMAEASDRIVPGSGDHYRAFADEKYAPIYPQDYNDPDADDIRAFVEGRPQYCPIDGFGLDEDGDCDRCQRAAAAEQAEEDARDMEWED